MEIDMSDIFAGISCLIALVALVQSVVSGRKVKDLDLQLKQKELELHNENEADAKKADVEVNNGYKPYQTILIAWDDESGKGRTKEMVIMVD